MSTIGHLLTIRVRKAGGTVKSLNHHCRVDRETDKKSQILDVGIIDCNSNC